jgi:hypothetical protein
VWVHWCSSDPSTGRDSFTGRRWSFLTWWRALTDGGAAAHKEDGSVVWCSKKGGCRVVFIGRGYRRVAQGSSNRFQLTRTLTRMRFDQIRERDKTQFMTIPIRLRRNPLTLRLKHGSTDRQALWDTVGAGNDAVVVGSWRTAAAGPGATQPGITD